MSTSCVPPVGATVRPRLARRRECEWWVSPLEVEEVEVAAHSGPAGAQEGTGSRPFQSSEDMERLWKERPKRS